MLRETNDDEFKWHPMLADSPSETDDELQSKSKGNLQTLRDFWKIIKRIDLVALLIFYLRCVKIVEMQ